MKRQKVTIEAQAWIRWVDTHCPLNGLCAAHVDLVGLCMVRNRHASAWTAEAWRNSVCKRGRFAGADRIRAAEAMSAQWDRIRVELEDESKKGTDQDVR